MPSNAVKIQTQFAKEVQAIAERQNPVIARIRPEFEVLRRQAQRNFEQNILVQDKKFKFGLGLQQTAQAPAPPEPKPVTNKYGIEAIADMNDAPLDSEDNIDLIEDRMEINSIAHKSSRLGRHFEDAQTEISYFQDLSPMTRSLANLKSAEEVMLLGGSATNIPIDAELLLARGLQQTDLAGFDEEALDNDDLVHFVMGRVPRTKLGAKLYRANGDLISLIKNEEASPTIGQFDRRSSRPMTANMSATPDPIHSDSDEEKENDQETLSLASRSMEIDDRIQDIYDGIKSGSPDIAKAPITQALGKLDTDNMSERQKFKTRLLFQFINEYKKLKEEKSKEVVRSARGIRKPSVPRVNRPLVKKKSEETINLDPSVYLYNSTDQSPRQEGITTTVMRSGWQTGQPVKHSPIANPKSKPKGGTQKRSNPKAANLGYKVNSRANRHITPTKSSIGKSRPQIQEKQKVNNFGWIGGAAHSREEFDDDNWQSVDESWERDNPVKN